MRRATPIAPLQSLVDRAGDNDAVKSTYSVPDAGSTNGNGSRNALMNPGSPSICSTVSYHLGSGGNSSMWSDHLSNRGRPSSQESVAVATTNR
jgi:hypothetical protein